MSDVRAALAECGARLSGLADPADLPKMLALLRLLYDTGRRDLPLGRLFEGHVDALQIVTRYGSETQSAALIRAVASGATLGVWNADLAGDPLQLEDCRLSGGKSFASGAGVLSHALVTAVHDGGRRLVLLDLARTPPAIDRRFWRVTGMQRSETHVVRWDDAPIDAGDVIGGRDDYVREPWFSGGALRFAAHIYR